MARVTDRASVRALVALAAVGALAAGCGGRSSSGGTGVLDASVREASGTRGAGHRLHPGPPGARLLLRRAVDDRGSGARPTDPGYRAGFRRLTVTTARVPSTTKPIASTISDVR